MRFSKATTESPVQHTSIHVTGCSDTDIGFSFLNEEPTVFKRRYANRVLVHECTYSPVEEPLALVKAEFLATSDPCYRTFEFFKTTEDTVDTDPTIEFVLNGDDEIVGVSVAFTAAETCNKPLQMAYRLYGYFTGGARTLLSNGILYITPCACEQELIDDSCGDALTSDIIW